MKILITGGAGFIGFHLATKLLSQGHTIVGIDNMSDYYDVSLKKARLAELGKHDKWQFEKLDICEYENLHDHFKKGRYDLIIHLAAIAGVAYALEHGDEYIQSNIVGTYNVFEAARKTGIKKIVYASSSAVYGNSNTNPYDESQVVEKQESLYGATKKANELLAYTFSNNFGIKSIGLRFFTVYGTWGRPDMALFLFTDAIVNNKPLNVNNRGKMYRDFTYVDDIVSGIIASIDYETEYDVFNLGLGTQIDLLSFIKEIEKNVGKKGNLKLLPLPVGENITTLSDLTKAQRELGYEPKTNVAEGVKKFVEWYKEYYRV